jgi:hypothetical protein
MTSVVAFKKTKPSKKHKGNTLCRRGFHKWVLVNKPFDVKRGGLVTCHRCERCGKERTSVS